MPRANSAFAAALSLLIPIGCPFLVGLAPAVGITAGVLSTQAAYAQSKMEIYELGQEKFNRKDYEGAIIDFSRLIELYPQARSGWP